MSETREAWEREMLALWSRIDGYERDAFIEAVDAHAAALPEDDPVALFERGGARDSMGYPEEAIPLYQSALSAGLTGARRRQATIQLASSMRNVGRPHDAVALLEAEMTLPADELTCAVQAFLALALVDSGRERAAAGVALSALAPLLPMYKRSLARYASELMD